MFEIHDLPCRFIEQYTRCWMIHPVTRICTRNLWAGTECGPRGISQRWPWRNTGLFCLINNVLGSCPCDAGSWSWAADSPGCQFRYS